MPTIATAEAFIVDGVATTALEQRLYDTAMFAGDGSNNGVRSGIVYHGPTSLGVTVNGSDQVTVQAGACVANAGTGQGVWRATLAAATSAVALSARNSTNPRIDLIVAQFNGTSMVIKTIDGTPGASPTAPALPAQHVELARVTVPPVAGGAVTVDSTWRTFASAAGGIMYVPTAARLPVSGVINRQRAIALDGVEHVWSGTAWIPQTVAPTPLAHASSFVAETNPTTYEVRSDTVFVELGAAKTSWGGGEVIVTLPSGYRPSRPINRWGYASTDATVVPLLIQTTGNVQTVISKASGGSIRGGFSFAM